MFIHVTFKLKNKPILLDNVDRSNICKLYNSIDCLFFPSIYEGFGMPPLEAMKCGVPVVSSNCPSLKEVVADAALTYDHNDINGFCNGLYSIMHDEIIRENLINLGLSRVNNFSWKKISDEIFKQYQLIING